MLDFVFAGSTKVKFYEIVNKMSSRTVASIFLRVYMFRDLESYIESFSWREASVEVEAECDYSWRTMIILRFHLEVKLLFLSRAYRQLEVAFWNINSQSVRGKWAARVDLDVD